MMNKYFIGILFMLLVACKNKHKETIGENEFYVCSMDPQVMEKQAGPCPICKMPLTKATIDKSQLNLIKLNDEQIKLANIKTEIVSMDKIGEEKTLSGIFAVNQNLLQQISSRFYGRIEKLYFKIPGQEVKLGNLIYEVYSRDLMLAEDEFLFAVDKSKLLQSSQGNDGLTEAAKNKLLLWGLNEKQIEELEKGKQSKIINSIYSKASGTITEIPFKEGDYITEGSTIFKLADLSSLWVEAQIYSNELNILGNGDKLQVIPEAFPEEIIDGEIDFSNPELQPGTKINLIRVKVSNKKKQFFPGMMAYVILNSKEKPAITLPVIAVLQSGNISLAWVRNKDGSFEARKIETGIQTKTKIEIVSGLKEGDVVVTSGAYLINSEYIFKRGMGPTDQMSGMKM